MENNLFEEIRSYIEKRVETLTYALAHADTMEEVKYIQGQIIELGMFTDKLRQLTRTKPL